MDELTEKLTDIGNQAQEAQQYLYEATAVMIAEQNADVRSCYISPKERKDRQVFLCLRLAQIEQCHNNILKNIKDIAWVEMLRIFNEKTHGLYKDQAPQIVAELAERMKREGRI